MGRRAAGAFGVSANGCTSLRERSPCTARVRGKCCLSGAVLSAFDWLDKPSSLTRPSSHHLVPGVLVTQSKMLMEGPGFHGAVNDPSPHGQSRAGPGIRCAGASRCHIESAMKLKLRSSSWRKRWNHTPHPATCDASNRLCIDMVEGRLGIRRTFNLQLGYASGEGEIRSHHTHPRYLGGGPPEGSAVCERVHTNPVRTLRNPSGTEKYRPFPLPLFRNRDHGG